LAISRVDFCQLWHPGFYLCPSGRGDQIRPISRTGFLELLYCGEPSPIQGPRTWNSGTGVLILPLPIRALCVLHSPRVRLVTGKQEMNKEPSKSLSQTLCKSRKICTASHVHVRYAPKAVSVMRAPSSYDHLVSLHQRRFCSRLPAHILLICTLFV
jgi:hypothetical protein